MKNLLFTISLFLFISNLSAQEFPFRLEVSESNFEALNAENVLFENIKKDTAVEINLPFDFPFFDEITSTLYITPFGSIGTHLFEKNDRWLADGNMLFAAQVKYDSVELVSYKIEADIVKIEWKNAKRYNTHEGEFGALDFQIWLYKNGKIEYRYGDLDIGFVENFEDLQSGIGYNVFENNCDFQSYWALQGTATQSQIMTLCSFRNLDELPIFNPESQRVYTFTPIDNFKDNTHKIPYNFTVMNGVYQELENPNYLIENPSQDTTVKVTLPFGVNLFEDKITDFFVFSGGFVLTDDLYQYENTHIIFPMLLDNKNMIATSVAYEISGSGNKRIYKIQWKNLHSQNNSHDGIANYQLWLFEHDGSVEFHYGPIDLDKNTNVDIGFIHDISDVDDEPIIGDIWMLQKSALNPSIIRTCNLEFLDVTTADIPLNDLIYHFGGKQTNVIHNINNNTVHISPTITTDFIQIQSLEKIKQIQVFNSNGQLIFNQTNIDESIFQLNLGNSSQGMYFIHVISELGDFVGKVGKI